ncbi:MAG: zinc ribbon domain-containing protein [Ignavibacterium sp.]|nr:zinc ribbon domain-containing protein [Ignavibacterium sp.]
MELLIIWAVFGFVGMMIGNNKGAGGMGCILGLLLGPIGWIITAVSKGDKVQCPYCKEFINKAAVVCPHCHKDISEKEIINEVHRDDVRRLKFNADKTGYFCPKCSTMNPIDMQLCRKCGEEIIIT